MTDTNFRTLPTRDADPAGGIESNPATPGQTRAVRRAAATVAALVGAGAAATVLAGPASAEPSYYSEWDKVADCESSGNWDIDTGNGFHGGLQFTSSTWGAYGGHKYADQADGASRPEQIEVARRVLDDQGPDAWPVCGPRADLGRDNGAATSADLPAHPGQTVTAPKKTTTSKSKLSASAKARSSARQRMSAARQQAAARTATRSGRPAAPKHAASTYTVRPGDTLSGIAQAKGLGDWHRLFDANRGRLHNPDVLHVGQKLALPS